MNIEFLSANRNMIPEIAERFHQEWGYLRPGSSVFRYIIKLNERINNNKLPLTIIAKSDSGKFLGTASLVVNDMETNLEFSPWVSAVFVGSEHRNTGIGRELLRKLENISLELGFNKIFLFTFDKEAFYSKLGWSEVRNDIYLNHQVSVMSKNITGMKGKIGKQTITINDELKHG